MANTADQRRQAIETILNCFRLCRECATECTEKEEKGLAECIKLCHGCASSCVFCVDLLTTSLPQYKQACQTCADLCDACAAECEKGEGDLMRQCAEACRQCAPVCRQLAA